MGIVTPGLSIDTKIDDLGWPRTAIRSNFIGISRSDGARCLEVGVHENPDLPEAFHERRMHEFATLD